MKKEITVGLFFDNGIFENGRIFSFCNDSKIFEANETFDKYGQYYKGEDLETNFMEIFTDHEFSIHSVIKDNGEIITVGDLSPNVLQESMKITSFYIHGKEIRYKGVKTEMSMGIL